MEFSRFESFAVASVTQLHSNVNKTKVLKSFSHAVLVRPWKLDMGLIGGWKCQRGVCVGADKPPMHFSSAHLSFLVIIITLWRLSVSHSLAEEWKSKQAGHDHLIPFVLSCSLCLSIVRGHRYGEFGVLPCKLQLRKPGFPPGSNFSRKTMRSDVAFVCFFTVPAEQTLGIVNGIIGK